MPLTHMDALAGNAPGLEPSQCPGSLALLGTSPEAILSRGEVVYRTVDVYRCKACERYVSVVRATALAIGSHDDPRPWHADMVRRIAGMEAPPPRPRPDPDRGSNGED